jgi:hypothetical protein
LLIIAAWIEDGGYEWVNAIININYQTNSQTTKYLTKFLMQRFIPFGNSLQKLD